LAFLDSFCRFRYRIENSTESSLFFATLTSGRDSMRGTRAAYPVRSFPRPEHPHTASLPVFPRMRAGKNPIPVSIELDPDESTGKASSVAEDFSRVIVNIWQNGFDAMREKANAGARSPQLEP